MPWAPSSCALDKMQAVKLLSMPWHMHVYNAEDTEAVIFVDAANAFNRQVTLRNTQVICPALAPILINTYRNLAWLFVDGERMLSKEGTTQGDPLAMAMYAIGTQPLIRRLDGHAKQVWYADDSSAGSSIERLKAWWDKLEEIGPYYGYFPKGSKTRVLVKQEVAETATEAFHDTDIQISTEGGRYLGGANQIGGVARCLSSQAISSRRWRNGLKK